MPTFTVEDSPEARPNTRLQIRMDGTTIMLVSQHFCDQWQNEYSADEKTAFRQAFLDRLDSVFGATVDAQLEADADSVIITAIENA